MLARIFPLPAAAVLALSSAAVAQQGETPENLLFDRVLPQKTPEQGAGGVATNPVVQPLTVQQPRFPVVQPWSLAEAQQLLAVIEGIGAEGLDPRDYRPEPLRQAIAFGAGPELDRLASETVAWLVEDLRDGRTPMDARKQWFVVDPDPDLLPTGELLAKAIASRDIAGTLASLNPAHPDYAAYWPTRP